MIATEKFGCQTVRVAVVIADSYGEPFESIKREIHDSVWKEFSEAGIDIFYSIGKPLNKVTGGLAILSDKYRYSNIRALQRLFDRFCLVNNNFILPKTFENNGVVSVNVSEGLRNLGVKMLATFEYLYNEEYDFVYKTTLSSILNYQLFREVLINAPTNTIFYAGTKISLTAKPFVSGANLFLNRKAVEYLLASKRKWNHGNLDDVEIGNLMRGVTELVSLPSLNIASVDEVANIPTPVLARMLHIRCKSNEIPRQDIAIMRSILERLSQK